MPPLSGSLFSYRRPQVFLVFRVSPLPRKSKIESLIYVPLLAKNKFQKGCICKEKGKEELKLTSELDQHPLLIWDIWGKGTLKIEGAF